MTPSAAVPLDAPAERVAEYERALASLPPGAAAAVLARVDAAVAAGDAATVRHVLDSLLGTARLGANPGYLRAVADADAAEARGDEPPEDVGDFVARMRAKHQG